MRTVVFQSFRTVNVPACIARCMQTVRDWSQLHGFDYRFLDDALFNFAPEWYRKRVSNNVLLVSDLARLVVARQLLKQGFDRAIWIDADLLVFAPEEFRIEVQSEFAFAREVWVGFDADGNLQHRHGINNSVCVFVRGNSILDFYIQAAQRIVFTKPVLDRLEVGTLFLSRLGGFVPLPLLNDVGILSPAMMAGLLEEDSAAVRRFAVEFRSPIHTANLCASFLGKVQDGVKVTEELLERCIDRMLKTKGEAVNRYRSLVG